MTTHCSSPDLIFEPLGNRQVVAAFDGGNITSDAGGLLLREVEHAGHFIQQFARCFTDYRDPELVEHTLEQLLKQRIFALCLGYEDLNDHDRLRYDPLLAVLVGKHDPTGQDRPRRRDQGKPLAGKSTLNRLELTPVRANAHSRYKKVVAHLDQMQAFFVEAFLQQHAAPPQRIILDLDSTDFVLHGHQLGRFFHGYYDAYCYLPLYIFCGDHPLLALLRPSNIDDSVGVLKHLARIVGRIRQAWPAVTILVRGDSGFCREHLMAWCEHNRVDYVFGLAKNTRLLRHLEPALQQAARQFRQTGQAARLFYDFRYQTRQSWSRERRVVGKAEWLPQGANPRFVVTSLSTREFCDEAVYGQQYCGRGDMENRLKEQQLMLFADRVSCATMRANQVRLCLATVAYVLMRALRQFGLGPSASAVAGVAAGTRTADEGVAGEALSASASSLASSAATADEGVAGEALSASASSLASSAATSSVSAGSGQAQCDTIRLRLLKVGAVVRVSVRRVCVSLSEAYPYREWFVQVWERLRRWCAAGGVVDTG